MKILDFGLAKRMASALTADGEPSEDLTKTGSTPGTLAYMSPEQVSGGAVDVSSDVFAFGVILHEMLAGAHPFEKGQPVLTARSILEDAPAPPADLPQRLAGILAETLQKDPDKRPPIRQVLETLKSIASRTMIGLEKRTPASVRTAVAAGAVAVRLALGWFASGWSRSDPSRTGVPRLTPFLATEAIEKQPAWSPTGNLIAYVSDRDGQDDIWITDTAGANLLNLTADKDGVFAHPSWSPDGRRIACYSEFNGPGIYTMTATGGAVQKLVSLPPHFLYTFSLQWSAGGGVIYTSLDSEGAKQVFQVQPAGVGAEGPKCLTCALGRGSQGGVLSPEGTLLAFTAPSPGRAIRSTSWSCTPGRLALSTIALSSRAGASAATHFSTSLRRPVFVTCGPFPLTRGQA